ncbi:hypothetical protein CF319_g7137 [Tilletia indica]|nr:hypothetical protein CF319_g7137 [Tilletia indica]
MTSPPSPGKLIKWPTHLSITTDAILSRDESNGYIHKLDAGMFDSEDRTILAQLSVWSRTPPPDGAVILESVSLATTPLRIAVPEVSRIRYIPEEFDGTDPEKPSLPTSSPFLSGIGVVKSVDQAKKNGVVSGFVFLGRATGFVRYDLNVAFEDSPQWTAWMIAPPRSLVSFDAILVGVDDDGTVKTNLRRMSYICDAHRSLVQALSIGYAAPVDRAAKIAEMRNASRAKRTQEDGIDRPAGGSDAGPSGIQRPCTPTKSPTKAPIEAPVSPTPVQTSSRKRGRVEPA